MLVGCGGGGTSSTVAGTTASGNGGIFASASNADTAGGGSSPACATFKAAYQKFLGGYTPPESQTGTRETPLKALADAVANINASGQLEQDLAQLGIDADLIESGSTEGGMTTPPSAFSADLQAVAADCGTTYPQPAASLVREA